MNERINESVNELVTVVEDELFESCCFVKLINRMASDVASEFELVKNLKGEGKCKFILDSMADLCAEDEDDEAVKTLYYFMKNSGAKVSQYVLRLLIKDDGVSEIYFLEAFFKIEGYVNQVVYYDDGAEDEEYEPIENEGWN